MAQGISCKELLGLESKSQLCRWHFLAPTLVNLFNLFFFYFLLSSVKYVFFHWNAPRGHLQDPNGRAQTKSSVTVLCQYLSVSSYWRHFCTGLVVMFLSTFCQILDSFSIYILCIKYLPHLRKSHQALGNFSASGMVAILASSRPRHSTITAGESPRSIVIVATTTKNRIQNQGDVATNLQ